VGTTPVVVVQPAAQLVVVLGRGLKAAGIGALAQFDLDNAFGLAVGT
jgi:hypothetical protein